MSKKNETIKKQFVLKKDLVNFIDKIAANHPNLKNSDIANEAIGTYLNIFFIKDGNPSMLGVEIQRICETGGKPWPETLIEGFGDNTKREDHIEKNAKPLLKKEVVKQACSLFTRLYREGLVSRIEQQAEKLNRSPFAAICHLLREESKR